MNRHESAALRRFLSNASSNPVDKFLLFWIETLVLAFVDCLSPDQSTREAAERFFASDGFVRACDFSGLEPVWVLRQKEIFTKHFGIGEASYQAPKPEPDTALDKVCKLCGVRFYAKDLCNHHYREERKRIRLEAQLMTRVNPICVALKDSSEPAASTQSG